MTWVHQEMSLGGPGQIPVHSTGTGALGATHCHVPTSDGHRLLCSSASFSVVSGKRNHMRGATDAG